MKSAAPSLRLPKPSASLSTVRTGKPAAIIVLSMVGKNYRLTKDMKETAAALRLPLAKTAMILRQVYADAPGQKTIVWHMGTRGRGGRQRGEGVFREILPNVVKGNRNLAQMKQTAG